MFAATGRVLARPASWLRSIVPSCWRRVSDPLRIWEAKMGSAAGAGANFHPLCCQPSKLEKGQTEEGPFCRLRGPERRCCLSPPVREMVAVPQEDTIAFIEPILISSPSATSSFLNTSVYIVEALAHMLSTRRHSASRSTELTRVCPSVHLAPGTVTRYSFSTRTPRKSIFRVTFCRKPPHKFIS